MRPPRLSPERCTADYVMVVAGEYQCWLVFARRIDKALAWLVAGLALATVLVLVGSLLQGEPLWPLPSAALLEFVLFLLTVNARYAFASYMVVTAEGWKEWLRLAMVEFGTIDWSGRRE